MKRMGLLVLLATAAFAACSGGDHADETTAEPTTAAATEDGTTASEQPGLAEDPDDVAGRLDLKVLSAVRTSGLLAVSVTTYERWNDNVLADRRRGNGLEVVYDANLDGKKDYMGTIVFANGTLWLTITGLGQAFEPVPVERPDNRTVQFVHPIDVLFLPAEGANHDIQVAVNSVFSGHRDSAGPVLVPAD